MDRFEVFKRHKQLLEPIFTKIKKNNTYFRYGFRDTYNKNNTKIDIEIGYELDIMIEYHENCISVLGKNGISGNYRNGKVVNSNQYHAFVKYLINFVTEHSANIKKCQDYKQQFLKLEGIDKYQRSYCIKEILR
jgi:hypothetical protein